MIAALRAAGIAAARVNSPADLLDDPQLRAGGFWQVVDHAVAGRFSTTGMPFRFASVTEPWSRSAPPLLGEHNVDVLGEILGLRPEKISELEADQVIGNRPAGV